MRIVHFSVSAIARQPWMIVEGLRKHAGVDAHLVDLERYSYSTFCYDIVFSEQPERAIELAETADIITLHNTLDLNSRQFAPIDFRRLAKKGVAFVRMFHTEPELIAQRMGTSVEDVLNCDLPSMASSHFQERCYPRARALPLMVMSEDPLCQPVDDTPSIDIFYSYTNDSLAFADRWATKSFREMSAMLGEVQASTGCSLQICSRMPQEEVFAIKRRSLITTEELITGTYHTSALEGLCMGKATLAYLDHRLEYALRVIAGTEEVPFINVRLEDAPPVLEYLLRHRNEAMEIGQRGREWIDKYWSEPVLVGQFMRAYQELLEHPGRLDRQPELRLDGIKRFWGVTLPDLIQEARARRYALVQPTIAARVPPLNPSAKPPKPAGAPPPTSPPQGPSEPHVKPPLLVRVRWRMRRVYNRFRYGTPEPGR